MPDRHDPLLVCSTRPCPACGGHRRRRRACQECRGEGFRLADLSNLWAPSPGFLVCGGPSLSTFPLELLRERGIVSLAVNNAAGAAPVKAWTFGDPQGKFHHGVFLDPSIMTFAPMGKLRNVIRAKLPDGSFRTTDIPVCRCPNTWGFSRTTRHGFVPDKFLTEPYAQWGVSSKSVRGEEKAKRRITTMLLGLRLMHYLGCPRIYMLGVDFAASRDRPYSFGEITYPGNRGYLKMEAMLSELRPVFDAAGFSVYNCNPRSECRTFDYVPFDEAFADCKGAVPPEPFDLVYWYAKRIGDEWASKEHGQRPLTLADLRGIDYGERQGDGVA